MPSPLVPLLIGAVGVVALTGKAKAGEFQTVRRRWRAASRLAGDLLGLMQQALESPYGPQGQQRLLMIDARTELVGALQHLQPQFDSAASRKDVGQMAEVLASLQPVLDDAERVAQASGLFYGGLDGDPRD